MENGTGSYVGYDVSSGGTFGERTIVHSGSQSMPLAYDNFASPWYSETERAWSSPQDWTAHEVDILTLYFRGASDNDPEALYVALEDSDGATAVAVHPDPNAVLTTQWIEWNVALANFTGVNSARVEKMFIGLGDRRAPAPGGAGIAYVDDIRLKRSVEAADVQE